MSKQKNTLATGWALRRGGPSELTIADFNGDGKPDVAATSNGENVDVLLNDRGSFRTRGSWRPRPGQPRL